MMIPPIDNTKDKKSLTMNDKPESSSVKKYKTCKNSSYTVHLKMTHTDTTRDGGAVTLTETARDRGAVQRNRFPCWGKRRKEKIKPAFNTE